MKKLKLRRADQCVGCDAQLSAGTEAWWDASAKVVRCASCVEGSSDDVVAPPAGDAEQAPDLSDDSAGRSARNEYERRSARERAKKEKIVAEDLAWREKAKEQRPVLGRLAAAMTPKPTIGPERQTTTAWKVGAEGEERVAEVLRDADGIEVLHDRQVPGTRANIDHLAVGPSGVFVIDAKKYKHGSAIEIRDLGGFFRSDPRLYLGGRDRTKLVDGVLGQIDVVRTALGPELDEVPIHGVLCFIGADWGWRPKTKTVKGVTAVWPLGLAQLVSRPGPHTLDVTRIADHLRTELPPARG